MEPTQKSKYYLIKRYKENASSGLSVKHYDTQNPDLLGDCLTDHLELAEHEAEEALLKSRAQGETNTWICVVERDDPRGEGLFVYSTGLYDGISQ